MKTKRFLAWALTVAMLATSNNFALDAHAMEAVDPVGIVETVEAVPEVTEAVAEVTELATEIATEEMTTIEASAEGGELEGTTDAIDAETASAYFTVTASGMLQWKNGVDASTIKTGVTVELPVEAKVIPVGIFDNNAKIVGLNIPEGSALTEIQAGAFNRSAVKALRNVPAAVTEIKAETFKDSKLQTITFEDGSKLQSIGKEAFAGSKLSAITMPNGVTTVGESAFKGCADLTSLNLTNVKSVGVDAFKGCSSLSIIGWSTNLQSVGSGAFSGCALDTLAWSKSTWAGSVVWGDYVFEKNKTLTNVALPEGMTSVPAGMFADCTALTYIDFPKTCSSIGMEAFDGCTALKKVTIPENINYISSRAFAGCQVLAEVTINQKGNIETGESNIVMAEDAFPKKTMTMKGYDGTVEDYADLKGYTFKTLFASHTITVEKSSNGSVSLSSKSAREGAVIEVKITPDAEYRLKASTFTYNEFAITTLKEADEASQTFTFVMPDKDVVINVDFEKTSVGYGTLSANFKQVDEQTTFTWNKTDKILTLDKVGLSAKLFIAGSKNNPGSWLFDYTSKNPKIATIDSEGVIYARGVGTTTITATLKSNSETKVSFKVTVENAVTPSDISLEYSNLKKAKLTTEVIDGKKYTVITYTKGNLAKSAKSFDIAIKATAEGNSTNLMLPSTWKISNTDLATVTSETVANNKNTINVVKGAVGETAIKISVTNGLTTEKEKVVYYEESVILRIVDPTPRLVQNKITVNSLCTTGTKFDLLSVYGYNVVPTGLKVVRSKVNENITEYEESEYVIIKVVDGKYYMDLTAEGKEQVKKKGTITYTNAYIEGEYSFDTLYGEETETFRTAIGTLNLTSKALTPTIKMDGKINLFYNGNAKVEEVGKVTMTQNLKDLSVERYELVSAANYAKEGSEKIDSFANNFNVSANGVITRSKNPLKYDASNKVVTSGYLKIYYAGYEPCFVKVTVPTQNVKPQLVLSMTKATVNTMSKGYELKLQLLDKKTKKAISLEEINSLSFDESASGTTAGLFENLSAFEAMSNDYISLRIKNAQKGKAVINVEMDNWSEPMKFTFNLSVVNKAPTLKAKPSTMTLNNICIGQEAVSTLTLNQVDVELIAMINQQFKGSAKMAAGAAAIKFGYDDGKLYAWADQTVPAGSYKFTFDPIVRYANGQTETLKAFAVTVKVVDKKLTATVKPSTVTLNNMFVGQEIAVTNYTVKNMPEGGYISVDDGKVSITGSNASASAVLDSFDFQFASDATKIYVTQTKELRKLGTYKFKISGLKLWLAGNEVTVEPFNVSVKVISKAAKLTVKSSGSLNISNPNSYVLYTLTTTNVVAPVDQVVVKELDTTNSLNKPYDSLKHFTVAGYEYNELGGIKAIKIKAKDDTALDAKISYKLKIGVIFDGADAGTEPLWATDVVIKPVQTLPKITSDVTSVTMYAGASLSSGKRSATMKLEKTTEKSSQITNVILAKSNPDSIKQAFAVSYDPDTEKATVVLLRPDLLRPNTEYSVVFEAKVAGQLTNTTGPQYTVKIKIQN